MLTRALVSAAAPGSAPVVDPCGQAGGKYKQTPVGGDSVFQTVAVPGDKTYQMGDLGSKVLPEHPDAVTTWKIGTTPRVAVSPPSAFVLCASAWQHSFVRICLATQLCIS